MQAAALGFLTIVTYHTLMRRSQKTTSRQADSRVQRYSLRRFLQGQNNELRLAFIFIVLIFLPSGFLGYLSWRAIAHEKLLARQKINESYRHFVNLAARDINDELENVQARLQIAIEKTLENFFAGLAARDIDDELDQHVQVRLQASVKKTLERLGPRSVVDQLDSLVRAEPLIAACVLLAGPGQVVYPFERTTQREDFIVDAGHSKAIAREFELFNELVGRGEELEYRNRDFDGAIAVYRQILENTAAPQLRAMALSLYGRAQTKKAAWAEALKTYENLLNKYPEVRDLNKMYLRFLAQYQIAVCLHNLNREEAAATTLLQMNRDLLERSDLMNKSQYSQFRDWIEDLAPKLLAAPGLPNAEYFKTNFEALAAQNKKIISNAYFIQLFEEELHELIINQKTYRPSIRYLSGQADDEPFLLGYLPLPDQSGIGISGMLGFQVSLARLREHVLPALLRPMKTSETVVLAILDNNDDYVIGTKSPGTIPLVTQVLDSPFKFWRAGVFVENNIAAPQTEVSTWLGLWLISLLLFSIFFGAYIFIRYARREARLSELKSTFVSRVSHELRTPLTSIKMLAEHLEMQLRQPAATLPDFRARIEQYLHVIFRESDRLGRLIENVLNFSKIERGAKEYNLEYEALPVVLQKALASFRPHAEAQGFVIKTEIDDFLPELLLDADGITQAVLNLLGNAVKYSETEKIITVRAFRSGKHACVEVEDHGIGISAGQISKIFEEFYRVDQKLNATQQSGLGLGLTLVQHIVQAHGGTVHVHSKEGKGSTFIITLPIPPDEDIPAMETAGASSLEKDQTMEIGV